MSIYFIVDVQTPDGVRDYIVREHATVDFNLWEGDRVIGPKDIPEVGNFLIAEDWKEHQVRDVVLRRTPYGWIESDSKIIGRQTDDKPA